MKYFHSLVLLFMSSGLLAQNFNITGGIYNEKGEPLESATIYAEKLADSSLISYTISNEDGSFELEGKSEAPKMNLFVSFSGYQLLRMELEVKAKIALDSLVLQVQDNLLEEVLVTARRSPITVKQDTLEFNAQSFDTRPNANLEELLKKLPGVEVDMNGDIKVNGKPVSRVLVNGEPFFGNDHKIATENLPKEIIDKVQVVNTKTKSEEFAGELGDPDNKTINITIQKDKNKGYFGRAKAGGGTNERYDLNGMLNYFNDEFRLSALGSSNNINKPGFSFHNFMAGMGQAGITQSTSTGANLAQKWKDDTKLTGDYFYGRNDTETLTRSTRENILPDSRYFSDSDSRSTNLNNSHRGNMQFELLFDEKTRLSISPRLNINNGISYQNSSGSSRDEDLNLINSSESSQKSESTKGDFSNSINFMKRYGKHGSFLQLNFRQNHDKQETDNFYYSESRFFEGTEEEIKIQDQFIDQENRRNGYAFEVKNRSYLADKLFLSAAYDFDYSNSANKRYVYDREAGDDFSSLNSLLSDDFEMITTRHTPNLELSYQDPDFRVEANFGLLHTQLKNENFLKESSFESSFNNLSARASLYYALNKTKSFSFRYNTNVSTPSIRQLQPLIDRTDPLNIVQGNPQLRPTYRQSMSLGYNSSVFPMGASHSATLNVNLIDNSIVPVVQVSEDLVRSTTYTNVNGGMGADLRLSYSNNLELESQLLRYSTGINNSYNRNIGFTNGVEFTAERYTLSPNVTLWYMGKYIQVNPRYSFNFSSTSYDINLRKNRELVSHSLDVDTQIRWPENVYFKNTLSFNYSGDVSPGYDNTSLMWNMLVDYELIEKRLNLGLEVYDLLNQNLDTRRIMGDDYIQDISNLILKQYFMLSLTFNLNKFGGRPQQGNIIRLN